MPLWKKKRWGIEEVVAIGYGTVKKRDITGSVASVSGEDIAAIPVTNAAQALKGKLSRCQCYHTRWTTRRSNLNSCTWGWFHFSK